MNRRPEMIPPLFHPARTLSGSLRSPPSPRGEGFVRRYSFSTYACICSDDARKAVFSFRSLPHWGRGTASAVDRARPREPLPLEGAAERSETGLASAAG